MRPLRIELAGGVYHVTSRGYGHEIIYLTNNAQPSAAPLKNMKMIKREALMQELTPWLLSIGKQFGVHYSTVSRADKEYKND